MIIFRFQIFGSILYSHSSANFTYKGASYALESPTCEVALILSLIRFARWRELALDALAAPLA